VLKLEDRLRRDCNLSVFTFGQSATDAGSRADLSDGSAQSISTPRPPHSVTESAKSSSVIAGSPSLASSSSATARAIPAVHPWTQHVMPRGRKCPCSPSDSASPRRAMSSLRGSSRRTPHS
jgi:hypothetical protein